MPWAFTRWVLLLVAVVACAPNLPASGPDTTVQVVTTNPITQTTLASAPTTTGAAVPLDPTLLLLRDAVMVTMDDALGERDAVLIEGGRIVAVGEETEITAGLDRRPVVMSLEGLPVFPGFIDSHNHRLLRYPEIGYASADEVLADSTRVGWTGLQELAVSEDQLASLIDLATADRLPLRVDAYLATNTFEVEPLDKWYGSYRPRQAISSHLRLAGLKFFVDFDWGREVRISTEQLIAAFEEAGAEGWQIAAKAISTEALETILDAYSGAGVEGASDRLRIEHALAVTESQSTRMAASGVIASIQTNMPGELVEDPEFYAFVDEQPEGSITPWRRLIDDGVVVAGGSAWPSYYAEEPEGAPFGSPLRLLYQAVTRAGNLGSQPDPWMLDQAITLEEALQALTVGAAYAAADEANRGTLTPGKYADLVLLSADPRSVAIEEVPFIEVLMTMVAGEVVWCHPNTTHLCP